MNKKPKVLAISYYYPPLSTPRSIRLAILSRYMAENDMADWTIVSAKATSSIVPVDEELCKLISPKINVRRVLSFEKRWFNYLSRRYSLFSLLATPDTSIIWYPFAEKIIIDILKSNDFDIIMSFSSPTTSHLVASSIQKKTGLPWIAFFSDPITNFNIINVFGCKENRLKKIETAIFNRATSLIFTNEYGKRFALKEYCNEIKRKAYVIPHAFDARLYQNEKSQAGLLKQEKMKILYAGIFYGKRQPEVVLESLGLILERFPDCSKDLLFVFLGSKSGETDRLIAKYGLSELVLMIPTVSYLDSLAIMQEADLLFVYDAEGEVSPFLPSKLVDYLGARKPIFGISPKNGPVYEILKQSGQFVLSDYEANGIALLIVDLWEKWKNGQLSNYLPLESFCDNFSIEKIATKYQCIFKENIT